VIWVIDDTQSRSARGMLPFTAPIAAGG